MPPKNARSGSKCLIREASLADLPEIMRHRREMFLDMGQTNPAALAAMECTSGTFIRESMAVRKLITWFAETSDAKIAGGVAVLVHPWLSSPRDPRAERAYILNMYVSPEHRRKGVARQLMKRVLDWCRAEGFRAVYLHASDAGRPLYEQLGFKPTNEMRLELSVE